MPLVEFVNQRNKIKRVRIPKIDGVMENFTNESLMLFGSTEFNHHTFRQFYGIGAIMCIKHFERFDKVFVKFGVSAYTRCLLVFETNARRQILTLKKGQYAQFYGVLRFIQNEDLSYCKSVYRLMMCCVAMNGWFVPPLLEIKKKKMTYQAENDARMVNDAPEESCIDFIDELKQMGL